MGETPAGRGRAGGGECRGGTGPVHRLGIVSGTNSTISWRSATTPLPKIYQPREIFNRLFASGSVSPADDRRRTSIIDFVLKDAKSLQSQVGAADKRKLDQYLTSIRDVEMRIERAGKMPVGKTPDYTLPEGIPDNFGEYMKILADLIVLALQTDTTRVITYVVANESSNRTYPEINVHEGHHETSHHNGNQQKIAIIKQINKYHMEQFAYFLGKLQSVPEGDGTLLDHSMVVYGSGNSDGNKHTHDHLPTLVVGGASGTIKSGRHIVFPRETPINNLWLSLLDRMDSSVESFGDATGRLPELAG